jgi:hypothetical protein
MLNNLKRKKRYINWKYKNGEHNPLSVLLELSPEKNWDWNLLFKNRNLKLSDILKHSKYCKYPVSDWYYISSNANITLNDILAHPELPWNWFDISSNANITLSDILAHPELPWSWDVIGENPNISFSDILKHPELRWNWYEGVSLNPNITIKDVLNHPEKDWNWLWISCNSNIKIKEILENSQLPWDWNMGVSQNHNITLKDALAHPEKNWNWKTVSMIDNFKKNQSTLFNDPDIIKRPEFSSRKQRNSCFFVWDWISENANITLRDFLMNPKKNWQWDHVSSNIFLWDRTVYKNNVNKDIKKRREKVKNLKLFGSLETLVEKYVGYV